MKATYEGKVICAWCGTITKDGDDSVPPSHTICDKCLAKAKAELANR